MTGAAWVIASVLAVMWVCTFAFAWWDAREERLWTEEPPSRLDMADRPAPRWDDPWMP